MEDLLEILPFTSDKIPDISIVGGKALSLIQLTKLNINVPPGIILTMNFFKEWMDLIKSSPNWTKMVNEIKDLDKTENNLKDIKEYGKLNLKLTEQQINDINTQLNKIFKENYKNEIYAVRSSSSDEDLKDSSFAGAYETKLGVNFENLEKNIIETFLSVFNFRVLKYKLEKNLNYSNFQIAIIIMKQIKCDSAGVAFSLNIKNNDYDEAIINSNFGLGETVVEGTISPDCFVINKLTKKIIEKNLGKKEKFLSIVINENNVELKENNTNENKDKYSLDEEQILLIINDLINIENSFKYPVDIEFGFENNVLYIFQARPITTYYKIPEDFLTLPNEQRILYFDETLGLQGVEKNLSILGAELSYFKMRYDLTSREYQPNPKDGQLFSYYGRSFQNISKLLVTMSIENFVSKLGMVNSFMKDIILKYSNQYEYKRIYKIKKIYLNLKNFVSIFWWGNLKALANPNKYIDKILESHKENFKKLYEKAKTICTEALTGKYTFKDLSEGIFYDYGCFFTYDELTILFSIGKGFQKIIELFTPYFEQNPEIKNKVFDISKCYINSTNIIGIELFKLSRLFDNDVYKTKTFDEFLKEYKEKKFPDKFYKDFQAFIDNYGCRCDTEIDIKNPRYSEEPEKVIKLIYDLIVNFDNNSKSPIEIFEEAEKKRPILHQELLKFSQEKKFDKEFEEAFKYLNIFFKEKETGKFNYLQILSIIKNYLNKIYEQKLEKSGLFEDKNEIYDLTVYQLSDVIENPEKFKRENIKNIIKENLEKSSVIGNWKNRPMFFDSRGRTFYPERKINVSENELSGESVSSGKITGKAVIMSEPNEKNISKDEILVAKAADPGWVVTIMKCGGLILEVGGTLQHGALLCREFNKPCIVNITNASKIIKDGDLIELDANSGIIRLINYIT